MRKKSNFQHVDNLIKNIEVIISKNRCSFSNEEKNQLSNVIRYLEKSKDDDEKSLDWTLIFKSLELLGRVFVKVKDFPDIF